jgi:hypothetical protein
MYRFLINWIKSASRWFRYTNIKLRVLLCRFRWNRHESRRTCDLNCLRIKGFYMFRSLLAYPQEVLHKRHFVYCVHPMSFGCIRTEVPRQSWYSQLTQHARNIRSAVCVMPPEDEQVILETCKSPLILNKLNKKWITLVSLYWCNIFLSGILHELCCLMCLVVRRHTVAECTRLFGCYELSIGEQLTVFLRALVPSFLGSSNLELASLKRL